jgi:hypothetical protein
MNIISDNSMIKSFDFNNDNNKNNELTINERDCKVSSFLNIKYIKSPTNNNNVK